MDDFSIEEGADALKKIINKAYKMGYIDCLKNYGVWQDGKQYIGVLPRPIDKVIKEVEDSNIPIRY